MATGEDSAGKTVKNAIVNLSALLKDPTVSKEDKLRLLILYIISQEGIKDMDRKRLMEQANITAQEHAAIANISFLGVTLTKAAKGSKKKKDAKKRKQRSGSDVPFELSRYVPALSDILEDLAKDNLPASEFPFVRDDPGMSLNLIFSTFLIRS